MIGTTVKLGFDATAVSRGFAKVGAGFQALGRKMSGVGKAMLAPFAKLMAVLAPILTAGAFAKGLKDVLDFGGSMSDLAARTGIAAGEIVVLQEAFRQAGMETADVATTLQRMSRNILDGLAGNSKLASDALETLGLTAKDIEGLDMAAVFDIVGRRISALDSDAMKASVSMALFGREGVKLVNLFKTTGAFEMARKSVGGLAGAMTESAGAFDHVSDALGGLHVKFRQLFAGIAQGMIGPLTQMADFITNLDLSKLGQQIGDFGRQIYDVFQSGQLVPILKDSFAQAAKELMVLLGTAAEFFAQQLNEAISKTSFGKTLGVKPTGEAGIRPQMESGAFGLPVLRLRRQEAGSVKSFGDMLRGNREGIGTMQSGQELSDTLRSISDLQRRRSWAEQTNSPPQVFKDIDKKLAEISRNTKPALQPVLQY